MPLTPMRRAPRAAAGLAVAFLGLGVASRANEPPVVVFKTRPPAVGGVISGRGPLDVTFNMCPTSDVDPGDQLKFTYDFDGDGTIDYYGHCRQTHRYAASNRCVDATVCAWDRQPGSGHRQCRTYSVCASGGNGSPSPSPAPTPTPTPTPSPSPSPDILPFTYDLYSFTASPGTNVDVVVDTVSAATAFDPWACISTTREGCVLFDENVVDWGDDDQPCTFPPPTYECPSFSATLPANKDGVYYLLVSDSAEDDFAGDVGIYSLRVTSDNAIGPLVRLADNVDDRELPPAPKSTTPATPAQAQGAAASGPRSTRSAPVHPAPLASPAARTDSDRAARPAPVKPAAPEGGVDAGASPAIASGAVAGSPEAAGLRPRAVFRTDPPASAGGRITGGASFEVTFDLCASKSADAVKEPIFTFDLDGDGVADESGSCRQTRRYELGPPGPRCVRSVVCVGDGEKAHETCRTYTICRSEGSGTPR